MNWKTEAVEKLRRYDKMCQAERNLTQELRRLTLAASAPRGAKLDGVGSRSANLRSREDALLNNMARRQELSWELDQVQRWLFVVNEGLEGVNDQEKLLLRQLYISPQKGGAAQLCEELGVEQSTLYRRLDAALRKFTLALYGAEE